jgi:TP901 family phage tail tape measure protein
MAEVKNPISPELIKSAETYTNTLLQTANALEKLIKTGNELIAANGKIATSDETATTKKKQLTAVEKESERIRKSQLTTHAKLDKARSRAVIALQKSKLKLQEVNKEVKNNIIVSNRAMLATEALKGSYNAISKALSANLIKWKQLTKAERETTVAGKKLTATIKAQRAELTKLDAKTGQASRGVGKYAEGIRSAAGSLVGAFGLVGGVTAFAKVLTSSIKTVVQYSKANSVLASVLGKTKKEIRDLIKDSQEFGKTTQFTATQVAQLQTELAKLGFKQEEIRESTQAVLDLALATDAELAPAAKVAGATLRAMGLATSEMGRVTSVLAVATTKSALSFEDYEGNLSKVLPVAKAFGFSLEDTVALFGKLRDSGFDASSAVTATRNIFLNMADANGALAKALGGNVENFDQLVDGLKRMNDEGFDLNETLQLTDKRSVAAFQQFLTGAESAKTLRDSLVDVNDELKVMVETRTDNAVGASKRLASAWDGVILKFKESDGVFKNTLDGLTSAINFLAGDDISQKAKAGATKTFNAWSEQGKLTTDFIKEQTDIIDRDLEELTQQTLDAGVGEQRAIRRAFEERVALKEALDTRLKLIEEQTLKDRANGLAERFSIETKSIEDLQKLQRSFSSFTVGEMKENADLILPLIQEQINERKKIQAKANRESASENAKNAKIEADVDLQIKQDLEQDIRDEDQKTLDFIEGLREDNIKIVDDGIKDIDDAEKTSAEERRKIAEKLAKDKLALELMVKNATVDLTAQGAQAITNILFESSSQRRDEELDRIEEQREEDLERIDKQSEEDLTNEDAKVEAGIQTEAQAEERKRRISETAANNKARIEEEADAKSAAIQTKQAKAEKAASLASVAINTAASIVKAFAQLGPIGGAAITPFLVASGAIQAATILATPIPQFAMGTDSTPGGSWLAGEAGREAIIRPDGSMFVTPNKATLYSDMPNHQVIPAGETKKMLADMSYGSNSMFNDTGIRSDLKQIAKGLKVGSKKSGNDGKTVSSWRNQQVTKHESFLKSMKS